MAEPDTDSDTDDNKAYAALTIEELKEMNKQLEHDKKQRDERIAALENANKKIMNNMIASGERMLKIADTKDVLLDIAHKNTEKAQKHTENALKIAELAQENYNKEKDRADLLQQEINRLQKLLKRNSQTNNDCPLLNG